MMNSTSFEFFGNTKRAAGFVESAKKSRHLFSLVISNTQTCRVPGITFAGADQNLVNLTPAADAEYLYYGACRSIPDMPMTPDGKPTPALLTKTALESSSIPHVVVDAGSAMPPKLPYIRTGLEPGRDISAESAMTRENLSLAIDYGRIVGRTLASVTDNLIIGESIPGGTTTALAVLLGLGHDARVSSSMAENPAQLKSKLAHAALGRLSSDDPYEVVREAGDPMIAFVAGMLNSASAVSRVLLAGGTQMAAVLAFASKMGFEEKNVALGTTSYILDDPDSDIRELLCQMADVGGIAVDPGLARSRFPGLRAYSEGFVKEGVGAGGATISSMIRTGNPADYFMELVQKEYVRAFTVR